MLEKLPNTIIKLNVVILKLLAKKIYDKGYTNLTGYMVAVLPILEDNKASIARNLGITRQAIYGIILKLEKLGYVEYTASKKDYRKKVVKLTESGKILQQACIQAHNEIYALINNEEIEKHLSKMIKLVLAEHYKPSYVKINIDDLWQVQNNGQSSSSNNGA